MNNRTAGARMIFAFPVVLAIGILLIPVVTDYADHDLAARAAGMTARWYVGHMVAAVAFGISLLSLGAVDDYLRRSGYHLPGFIKIMMAIGAGLYAAGLGADGIGPIAVRASGADASLFFDGSGWWVSGTFFAAVTCYGIGLISLVGHANNAKMLSRIWGYTAFFSALLFVAAPAIPSGWALYGVAIAAFGVFLPLGLAVQRSR